jgi:deoxyhypusine synthase
LSKKKKRLIKVLSNMVEKEQDLLNRIEVLETYINHLENMIFNEEFQESDSFLNKMSKEDIESTKMWSIDDLLKDIEDNKTSDN